MLTTTKSIWISAVVVVAPVPFVTTIASDPDEAVLLLIERAAPVVAPLISRRTIVEEAVIAELVMVRVRSAAAAIDTEVKVARPDLPLTTAGSVAATLALGEFKRIPVPKVDATKLPLVAVMLPKVAVRVVVVVSDPGAMIAEGREIVAVEPTVVTVLWLAVPRTVVTVPEEEPS